MTVQLVRMSDASVEPNVLPKGTRIVAGYIGGNTPHVWTWQEWERFSTKKLPIFVGTGPQNGIPDAWAALERLYQLNVPKHTVVAYDVETQTWPVACRNFFNILHWAGYYTWIYGSQSTIFSNPRCSGYWVASYKTPPQPKLLPLASAVQYESGDKWDSSVVSSWQYVRRLKAW